MKLKSPAYKRLLRWLIILLLALAFVLYFLLPAGLGVAAVFPSQSPSGDPPEGLKTLTLESNDGVKLAGWYSPPKNSAAIILLDGAGASREAVRLYAEMLARHGYGVLAFDLRGHGESGGPTNRLG